MITNKLFFLFALVAATVFTTSCKKDDEGGTAGGYPKTVEITYKVTGSLAKADILYTNDSGGNDFLTDTALPFTKTITRTVKRYDSLGLGCTAYEGGNVKLEILVDGTVVDTKTFTGTEVVSQTASYFFN
jgi:hypothetical protein